MNESMNNTQDKKADVRPMWIRVIAMIAVIGLAGMFVGTIVCLIIGAPKNVLFAFIVCDIIVPIFVWLFLKVTDHQRRLKDENQN